MNHEAYEAVLCMNAEGLMGFIEIPQIHIYLPIYHGTSEHVLQLGAGHLEGSSLPIGGLGTKAVISAHTGMNAAPMFSDLSELQPGDEFFLHVLKQKLVYEVCDIEVVLPEETQILGDDAQTDVAHKADNRQRRGWKSQWMTSYAKAVCFSVGILLVLYCVCRGVHIVQIRKRKNMMCGQK